MKPNQFDSISDSTILGAGVSAELDVSRNQISLYQLLILQF